MNCEEAQGLTDLYALNALPINVAEELEAHLEICPICRADLAEAARVARLLELTVPSVQPSGALRERLLRSAEGEVVPATPVLRIVPRESTSIRRQWFSLLRAPQLMGIAAIIPLLVSVGLALELLNLQQEVTATRSELARSYEHTQVAVDVISRSMRGGTMATVSGTDMAPGAWGTLYFVPTERNAVLVAQGLPAEPAGQGYQLWFVTGDQRMNGGMLDYRTDDESCTGVSSSPIPLGSVDSVGVTLEPSGGSMEPHGQRYLWASLHTT